MQAERERKRDVYMKRRRIRVACRVRAEANAGGQRERRLARITRDTQVRLCCDKWRSRVERKVLFEQAKRQRAITQSKSL